LARLKRVRSGAAHRRYEGLSFKRKITPPKLLQYHKRSGQRAMPQYTPSWFDWMARPHSAYSVEKLCFCGRSEQHGILARAVTEI
jgi:hypothetical protein